ncbi:hypothetical protein [Knoellia koreensis]|uniref:Scramblase n=1 Tax=Knoellia koreensis TaxID=2730921 RepID=A0A849HJC6_9MICO|nr:hypothetical protein [Knoellia sp. DB2414S]NNM47382.1 hypothetical protein [Knoellia sp. DB2414S]
MSQHPTPERYALRQKLTMMVNRYEIRPVDANGAEGPVIAVAQQKRMAFKEQVTFYADEARSQPVFSFKARQRMDLGATYDVFDAAGTPIGWFKKDFGKSLLRSSWHLGTPDGLQAFGTERNQNIAILRRIWEFIPVVGEIPLPFIFHFDFKTADGSVVLTSERRMSLRDRYDITIPKQGNGYQLDWRVGLAMSVALDALQSR